MTHSAKESQKSAALDRFVEEFKRKLEAGALFIPSSDHEYLQHLAGRVTRGSTEDDFVHLQKDVGAKKFAWVMGADGLSRFLTQSNLDALRSLGCEDRWIRRKLENGEEFRLGIFYRSDQCIAATWDGIFSLIDGHYSENISAKIRWHSQALKSTSYDDIEERARLSYLNGLTYFDVNEASVHGYSSDPRFMSEERFAECEGTLEESRGFLYHRLGLSKLFDGSGFTKDANGRLGVREYLQPNVPIRDIPGFRYLPLPIDLKELMDNPQASSSL